MRWLIASNALALALVLWLARGHSQLSDRVAELESHPQPAQTMQPVTKHLRVPHSPSLALSPIEKRLRDLEDHLRASKRETDERSQPSSVDTPSSEKAETPPSFAQDHLEDIAEHFEDIAEHFEDYDSDKSGLLSADELSLTEAEVRRFDLNNDSELGQDEVSRLGELAEVARQAATDMTGAGFPIRQEALWDKQRFSFLDSNHDGLVTEGEYVAALASSVRQVRRFDLDQDGGLTHAELWDAPTRFARLDLDGDALVYAWEVLDSQTKGKW